MPKNSDSDSSRSDDLKRAAAEIASRLESLGITLTGREQPEELAQIEEGVERFESAVESRGGDLMVDEGPRGKTSEPDDPHFALPVRNAHETVVAYLERLARATAEVKRHPRRN